MLRLTLAQMRHSTGRLLAAGVAIVVGTAFIAATLVGSAMIRDTTYAAMTAEIGNADVVAQSNGDQPLTTDDLAAVRALPGTFAADGQLTSYGSASAAGRQAWIDVSAVPAAGLETPEPSTGELPRSLAEVTLTESVAERLEVTVGDTVDVEAHLLLPDENGVIEDETGMPPAVDGELTVVGLVPDPLALVAPGNQALVSGSQRDAWVAQIDRDLVFGQLLVVGHDDVTPEALAAEVAAALPDRDVLTGRELAELRTAEITGQSTVFTVLVLAFGAVAMAVAAIVITNTFQVIVAQRAHTLALLRAVGSTRGQVRRSVLLEALVLGTLGGATGLLAGLGLAQLAVVVLGSQDLGFPIPDSLAVTPAVVLAPILTGAVVTLLAALAPARAATRVSPLAALRPPEPPDPRGASRLRLVASTALVLLGALLLVAGPLVASAATLESDSAIYTGLALGISGGVISFAGVMLGVVFLAPGIVRALGGVVGRLGGGSTVRLATANATRNPRRTAATATALVIGVALVSLMSTGAVTARASLDAMLRAQYPVDLTVESGSWNHQTGRTLELSAAQRETVATTPGVTRVLEIEEGLAWVVGADAAASSSVTVEGIDPALAPEVMRDPAPLADLSSGTVLVRPRLAADLGLDDGDTVTLGLGTDPSTPPADGVELTLAVVPELSTWAFVVTPEVLAEIDPDRQVTMAWAQLDGGTDAAETITLVQDRLTELDAAAVEENTDPDVYVNPPYVMGPAAERVIFEQVIDTLLAIVVGLLGVAVVIALIGVANTLSLSVIERRRESAVLRAMGLTRGQLRGMLAVEGVFLAVVGVLIGAVIGVLYGWSGSAILLGQTDELTLAVPWVHLAVIVAVAVAAGLVASVLPARRAVRTPPVAALAAE